MRTRVRKKEKPKKTKFHIVVKIHSIITMFVFVAYVCSGVLLGPDLLLNDVKDKYAFAASSTSSVGLSLWVAGPPEIPVLEGYSQCDMGNLAIWLNWTGLHDVTNHDLYRDGEILVSGLTTNSYNDTNISQNSSYTYYVISNGPMGMAQSDPITVSTGTCEPPPPPDPTCNIGTFAGINLSQHSGILRTEKTTPAITGTTNMANAQISIEIFPGPIASVSTVANNNGYWYWSVPTPLALGSYTLVVVARDPDDQLRSKTTSMQFEIFESEDDDDDDDQGEDNNNQGENNNTQPSTQTNPQESSRGEVTPPASTEKVKEEISLEIRNNEKTVLRGQKLFTRAVFVGIDGGAFIEGAELKYQIIDMKGMVLHEAKEDNVSVKSGVVEKDLPIPVSLGPGKYKLSIILLKGDKVLGAEDFFLIKDLPFTGLSGGVLLMNENLVSNLGWVMLILLVMLVVFLLLLWIEHGLYMHALGNVVDDDLDRKGMISKRKEVTG
jgi:hypothetical protein